MSLSLRKVASVFMINTDLIQGKQQQQNIFEKEAVKLDTGVKLSLYDRYNKDTYFV